MLGVVRVGTSTLYQEGRSLNQSDGTVIGSGMDHGSTRLFRAFWDVSAELFMRGERRAGKPGVLQSVGPQRVRPDLATEQQMLIGC